MKSSLQIADVMGMIMIVRTSPAVKMLPPAEGVPEKTGSSPSGVSWIHGSRC